MKYFISYDVCKSIPFSGSHEKHYCYTYHKEFVTLAEGLDEYFWVFHICARDLDTNLPTELLEVPIPCLNKVVEYNPSITIDEALKVFNIS